MFSHFLPLKMLLSLLAELLSLLTQVVVQCSHYIQRACSYYYVNNEKKILFCCVCCLKWLCLDWSTGILLATMLT